MSSGNIFGPNQYANNGYRFNWNTDNASYMNVVYRPGSPGAYGAPDSPGYNEPTLKNVVEFAWGWLQAQDTDNGGKGDGYLSKEEFIKYAPQEQKAQLEQLFEKLDKWGYQDGKLDLKELATFLYAADGVDKDGKITKEEIKYFVENLGNSEVYGRYSDAYTGTFGESSLVETVKTELGDRNPLGNTGSNGKPWAGNTEWEKLANAGWEFNFYQGIKQDVKLYESGASKEVQSQNLGAFVEGIFTAFDVKGPNSTNPDKKITKDDFGSDAYSQKLFKSLDINGNGEVTRQELAVVAKFIDGINSNESNLSGRADGTITADDMDKFMGLVRNLDASEERKGLGLFTVSDIKSVGDLRYQLKFLAENTTAETPSGLTPVLEDSYKYSTAGEKFKTDFKNSNDIDLGGNKDFNVASYALGIIKSYETGNTKDGVLSQEEIDNIADADVKKLLKSIANSNGDVDAARLSATLKLMGRFDDNPPTTQFDGKISNTEKQKFLEFVKNLDASGEKSAEYTSGGSNPKINNTADLRDYIDRVVDSNTSNDVNGTTLNITDVERAKSALPAQRGSGTSDYDKPDRFFDEGKGYSLKNFFDDDSNWHLKYTDEETKSQVNTAAVAFGLIEAWGGKNGILTESDIDKIESSSQRKFLQALKGNDDTLSAKEVMAALLIMDTDGNGEISYAERNKLTQLDSSSSNSSGFNAKDISTIANMKDLKDVIRNMVDTDVNNDPSVKIDDNAYFKAKRSLESGSNEYFYSEGDNVFKFMQEGQGAKKFSKSGDWNVGTNFYQIGSFFEGYLKANDDDGDGEISKSEFGESGKYGKFFDKIAGEDGNMSKSEFAVLVQQMDANSDGVVDKNERKDYVDFVSDLKNSDKVSDEYESSGQIKTVGDLRRFMDEVISGQFNDDANSKLHFNTTALSQSQNDYIDSKMMLQNALAKMYEIQGSVKQSIKSSTFEAYLDGKDIKGSDKADQLKIFNFMARISGKSGEADPEDFAAYMILAKRRGGSLDDFNKVVLNGLNRKYTEVSINEWESIQQELKKIATNLKTSKLVEEASAGFQPTKTSGSNSSNDGSSLVLPSTPTQATAGVQPLPTYSAMPTTMPMQNMFYDPYFVDPMMNYGMNYGGMNGGYNMTGNLGFGGGFNGGFGTGYMF